MKCPRCGLFNPPSAVRCDCGHDFQSGAVLQSHLGPRGQSGIGASSIIPPEVQRWNWGAFLLNWIWGLRHRVYISLLVFVPFVNIAIPFILGAKGNEWAWRKRKWGSTEEFLRTQRTWSRWGVGLAVLAVVLNVLAAILADGA